MRGKRINVSKCEADHLVILLSSTASKSYSESEFIQNSKDVCMFVENNIPCSKNALYYEL